MLQINTIPQACSTNVDLLDIKFLHKQKIHRQSHAQGEHIVNGIACHLLFPTYQIANGVEHLQQFCCEIFYFICNLFVVENAIMLLCIFCLSCRMSYGRTYADAECVFVGLHSCVHILGKRHHSFS